MPDTRSHRGQNPKDSKLFASRNLSDLKQAVEDYSLLLTKNYPPKSSLKLVGDKFNLTQRQRLAVMRCGCSDEQKNERNAKEIPLPQTDHLVIDGYNLLITIESALSDGFIFISRDGCFRDLASIHGSYRKVQETTPALKLIGNFLASADIDHPHWLLDSPVSNSGRLKKIMLDISNRNNFGWTVELLFNPDNELIETQYPIVTSDSNILDNCRKWVNLARLIIETEIPRARVVEMA